MSEDLTKKLSQDEKLTVILTTVQSLTVRFDSIDSRLQRVEQTVDDARPVLQLLVTNVAQLQEGQRRLEEGYVRLEEKYERLEEGQKRLRSDLTDFRRHVDQQFLKLSGTVEGRYREHDKRIARLEANANLPNTET